MAMRTRRSISQASGAFPAPGLVASLQRAVTAAAQVSDDPESDATTLTRMMPTPRSNASRALARLCLRISRTPAGFRIMP